MSAARTGVASGEGALVSVVVPTYKEAEGLPHLARAVDEALGSAALGYELVVVDDWSGDGTDRVCAELAEGLPVRLVERRGERGLSTAVIRGIEEARGDVVVVMDADLSHPPSAIPEMVRRLRAGESDFVLGSRYAPGGSIYEGWTLRRKLNSLVPSLLSRPLCPLADPMSGFFAIRRAEMPPRERLSPLGFKIALEVYVKGRFGAASEVPIHFAERRFGQSKLTLDEQLLFARHLGRLYSYKLLGGVLGRRVDGR